MGRRAAFCPRLTPKSAAPRLSGSKPPAHQTEVIMKYPTNLILIAALLSGCSSITEGTSQEIVVNTTPEGANCSLVREGISVARIDPTPGAATIKKTKDDITIECTKKGYENATYFNKSGIADGTFGNIILGGGIGWAIDSASG